MAFTIVLSLLPIAGAVAAAVALRRSYRAQGPSDLDAEVEANRWVVRLGGSLSTLDPRTWAGADQSVTRALADASERLHTARARLRAAHTAPEYVEVTATAMEGLDHIRSARTALGLDPGPPPPPPGRAARDVVPTG
ncbi:hypothetical protein [Streptomyces sp. UG1]|uniref:hypothetical protein n=1 Tax=Streptomyces sp. UG1 TaxID=3417652 RepID=UPI003CF9F822